MPKDILVKLVRDNIADHLASPMVSYRPIPDMQVVRQELRKKLIEEASEYLINPCLDELADVLTVCRALAEIDLSVNDADVSDAIRAKNERKGTMLHGIGMYVETLTRAEFDLKRGQA